MEENEKGKAAPAVTPALEPEETFLEEIWQLAAVDVKNGMIVRRRP